MNPSGTLRRWPKQGKERPIGHQGTVNRARGEAYARRATRTLRGGRALERGAGGSAYADDSRPVRRMYEVCFTRRNHHSAVSGQRECRTLEITVSDCRVRNAQWGEVAEWLKAAVLKTVEAGRLPGVRIPSSPSFAHAGERASGPARRGGTMPPCSPRRRPEPGPLRGQVPQPSNAVCAGRSSTTAARC